LFLLLIAQPVEFDSGPAQLARSAAEIVAIENWINLFI
jgi:hypothetical protein